MYIPSTLEFVGFAHYGLVTVALSCLLYLFRYVLLRILFRFEITILELGYGVIMIILSCDQEFSS